MVPRKGLPARNGSRALKTNWAVIAENSAIDRDTNNISLFNVIEEVHIPEPPEPRDDGDQLSVVALRFVFVALFARSEAGTGEKKEVRLTIALPDGKSSRNRPNIRNRSRHRGSHPDKD